MLVLALLLAFAICMAPSFLAARFTPPSKPRLRYWSAIALFTLLASPSFLAGGILAIPVPFGAVLLAACLDLQPSLVPLTFLTWPTWHTISFSVSALVGMLVFVRIRPNQSSKRTRKKPRAA